MSGREIGYEAGKKVFQTVLSWVLLGAQVGKSPCFASPVREKHFQLGLKS